MKKHAYKEQVTYNVGINGQIWWTGSSWVEPPLLPRFFKGKSGYCSLANCKESELESVINKLKIAKIKAGNRERIFVIEWTRINHPVDPARYVNDYELVLGKLERVKR